MGLFANRLKEERPWGSFERFTHNEPTTVKIIRVAPGKRFSLQYHEHRSEFWLVLSGSGTATLGEAQVPAHAGAEFMIPEGTKHRMEAGADGIEFLEIAFGTFDEKDIVRLEDDFGRS